MSRWQRIRQAWQRLLDQREIDAPFTYPCYLQTETWKQTRALYRLLYPVRHPRPDFHHLTYANLGREIELDADMRVVRCDIEPLSQREHRMIHRSKRYG